MAGQFEKSLSRLEEIIGIVESGETGLEDAMELYKEGIALSKACGELLDRYENEISVLVKQSDDTFSLKPFAGARPEAL